MSNEIPYQVGPQVAALRQERENCVAYGNDKRVASIDRQLAEYGVKQDAAQKRSAASEGDENSRRSAPKGRRGKATSETTEATGTPEKA